MPAVVSLSPLPLMQFNQGGAPVAGGLLFTYASGTTTKTATYTDSTGATPNTNPIILDSNGQCALWLVTGTLYTLVLSPPGDTDPPTNPYWTENGVGVGVFGNISATGNITAAGTVTGTNIVATSNLSSPLIQAGPLANLNSGSGKVVIESSISGVTPALIAMNTAATNDAVTMVARNDRTDGISIAFQFGAAFVGTITQNGSTTSYNVTSDGDLKNKTGDIEYSVAAAVIEGLSPLWYAWKATPDQTPEPGFFAQEVHAVCPWAARESRGDPLHPHFIPWQLDAIRLFPFMVAHAKGLAAEVRQLKDRVAALEARSP
jgi:hypothetical protein